MKDYIEERFSQLSKQPADYKNLGLNGIWAHELGDGFKPELCFQDLQQSGCVDNCENQEC